MTAHTNGAGARLRPHKRLRILFLTPRFPWPLIGGDRIKSYHLLRHLARRQEVTLVAFNHGGPADDSQRAAMADIGVELYDVPLNPVAAGLRSVGSLFNGLPLEIAFYTQPEFTRIVDELCATRKFDLGVAFFMRTAEYLRKRPFKKLLIAEDCRLMYQSRSSEASESFKQRLVRQWEVRRLQRYEPAVADDFDCTSLVTNEDIAAMRRQNPNALYALLTNGVELDVFSPNFDMAVRAGLLFAGKLDVYANDQMARAIVRDILPAVRAAQPGTTLSIVGSRPRPAVQRLAGEGVEIHPNVPSFTPYLQSAAVFLHPHKGASGIQNKILQAMACGCPVVTSPTGIQGIAARHGGEVMIAHTEEDYARHVVTLLHEPKLAEQLARNARKVVEEHHSWAAIDAALDNIIAGIFPENTPKNSAIQDVREIL